MAIDGVKMSPATILTKLNEVRVCVCVCVMHTVCVGGGGEQTPNGGSHPHQLATDTSKCPANNPPAP